MPKQIHRKRRSGSRFSKTVETGLTEVSCGGRRPYFLRQSLRLVCSCTLVLPAKNLSFHFRLGRGYVKAHPGKTPNPDADVTRGAACLARFAVCAKRHRSWQAEKALGSECRGVCRAINAPARPGGHAAPLHFVEVWGASPQQVMTQAQDGSIPSWYPRSSKSVSRSRKRADERCVATPKAGTQWGDRQNLRRHTYRRRQRRSEATLRGQQATA